MMLLEMLLEEVSHDIQAHGSNHPQRDLKPFFRTELPPAWFGCTTYTCAFKPGYLMSHNWLHTPDRKASNEMICSATQHTLHSASS